jgi:predicted ATPase/class 3 adenylate cyclase
LLPSYALGVTVCSNCGRKNPDDAQFCNECGAPLLAPASLREERKVVSVLCADLVGFTGWSEGLDPEDVRALQDSYWLRLRAELERHGGTVEKFIGDAVVALFGAPVAHEDDPERAVRAAVAIRDWAREDGALQVRVAVATGETLVRLGAQPLAGEGMASGDVVNTVSRLQALAPANGVLVDETTFRATRNMIEYTRAEPVEAKGKRHLLPIWEALEARSRLGTDVIRETRALLVGRERELDVLRSAFERAREGSSQFLTLVGVPGIGKSRLVYELGRSLDAEPGLVRWRQGRSLPYGEGAAFWALGEIVKAEAGILETDAADEAAAKLARTAQLAAPDEAEWIGRHLRPLVGIAVAGATDDDVGREAFAAWRRLLEGLAEERPSVFVFEDLHWADDGMLDFIDHLLEWVSDVPIFVLCTARPELLERRRAWGGGKRNTATLTLSPLSGDETAALVGALVDWASQEEERAALVERVGGNPLYAEQYAFLVSERGTADDLPLPETVHATIAARLDTLPADEKRLLHGAAVFGKIFWSGAAATIAEASDAGTQALLHALERKEFIQRSRRSSVPGEAEYAFCHVLLRDVAYGQIPRATRAGKHEKAAEWLESLARPEDHADMLAHHYSSALEFANVAEHERIATRARPRLAQAGDRAFALSAYAAATRYYERALALSPDNDSDRPQLLLQHARALFATGNATRGDVLEAARDALLAAGDLGGAGEAEALLGEVWWWRGQRDRCSTHLERALALVAGRPTSRGKARVLSAIARYQLIAGKYERAMMASRQALAMADALDLDELRAQALITLGMARFRADEVAVVDDIERGLEIALESNQLHAAARAYIALAAVTHDLRRATELEAAAEQLYRRLGDSEGARFPRALLAFHAAEAGQWDEALAGADAFIAECEAGNPHYQEPLVRHARAEIRLARGDSDGAIDDVQKALALARVVKDPQTLFFELGFAARVHADLGHLDEARTLARELLTADQDAPRYSFSFVCVSDRLGLSQGLAELFRSRAHAAKRWDAAALAFLEGRFADAVLSLEEGGYRSPAAYARLRGAETLLAQGRRTEANEQLENALGFYRTVGATRYIREAEEMLATRRSETAATQPRA